MKFLKTLTLLLFVLPMASFSMPQQILLIRHAEKPTLGSEGSELSAIGWQRAKALPTLFSHSEFSQMKSPEALFAMAQRKPGTSIRPIQTLQFLSEELKLPIQTPFARDDYAELVRMIKKNPNLNNKSIVICWEGTVLTDIAEKFGVRKAPKLHSRDFDRAWLLTFDSAGNLTRFEDLPQKLLYNDSKQ